MNFQSELEHKLVFMKKPERLLLHSCCAPCSSYVLEYLSRFFIITVFYYNPNITEEKEYRMRVEEQKKLIDTFNQNFKESYPITFMEGTYNPNRFFESVKGLEGEAEGGKRCTQCFMLRLEETAKRAKEGDYDCFTTTLTISPLKDAKRLNEIGQSIAAEYEIEYLTSDFKKKNGYKRSIELSREFELYRQDYCGCIYSKIQREREKIE